MAKRNVHVVLKRDVEGLGLSGDIAKVRPGFARNYLIPRGMAVIATRANVRQIEHEKQLALQRLAKTRAEAEEQAKQFKDITLHVAKQVSDPETGKLFGAISVTDVMDALKMRGFEGVDKRQIELPDDAIKATGSYEVAIRLKGGVIVPVKLEVKTAA